MNKYKHDIILYRMHASHLTLLEHGIYRQILDTYYLTKMKPLPDMERLARLICAKTREEQSAMGKVLADFFVKRSGGYVLSDMYLTNKSNQKKAENDG